MTRIALLLLLVAAAGCGSAIDSGDVSSIEDYPNWQRQIDVVGPAAGHGDTFRAIFVNETTETFVGAGLYPVGSIIVKEVRAKAAGDTAGDLAYLAIMRKLEEAPPGGALDDGWLFTRADELGTPETNNARCFRTCHQAAPFDGTFFDWSSSR